MLNLTKFSSALLALALGTGCVGSDDARDRHNDPPLADPDELFQGAPDKADIPRTGGKADGVLPAQFTEIRDLMSPVQSQGRRGVCSIFSTVAYMEHLYLAAGEPLHDFSEQYLQWSAKFEVGSFPRSSGSNARSNITAIADFGIPLESVWPYEINQWDELDDPECDGEDAQPTRCYTNGEATREMKDQANFRLPRSRFLHPLDLKSHLKETGLAAVVGMDFFYQSWNHRRSDLPTNDEYWDQGFVLEPNAEDRRVSREEEKRAGHSILILGWDDDLEVQRVDENGDKVFDEDGEPVVERGFYLFKNSWGTDGFGIENEHGAGYGWISMAYVHEFGRVQITGTPRAHHIPEGSGDPEPSGELSFRSDADLAIPDNDQTGIQDTIEVSEPADIASLSVELDIDHTFKGDLRVTLTKDGTTVTLHNRTGGGARDIKQSFELTDFNGSDVAGVWTLSVVDSAGLDTGTLNSWALKVTTD